MRSVRIVRAGRRRPVTVAALVTLLVAAAFGAGPAAAQAPPDAVNHPLLQPIDAQNWVDQAELTWDAYTPIRPPEWNSAATSQGSQNQYKTAVILLDFSDQPFLITQAPGTHPFGNPQPGWQPIPQDEVADWMYDYYAVPNEFNGGQTLHAYWMEDSHGKIGVDVTVFGPYTMPGKPFEYGIAERLQQPGQPVLPAGQHVQPEHPRATAATSGVRHRLPGQRQLRLRQRLLRDGRPRRVVHVAGVRRDALARPERGSRASSGRPARPRAPCSTTSASR